MRGTALDGCTSHLDEFLDHYRPVFQNKVQKEYFKAYIKGLLGPVERKSIEPIALEQGIPVLALQRFIGIAPWDDELLLHEHARCVSQTLGMPTGVLVLDPTSAPKRGDHSVGVKRQWCGQLGKEENCQVWVNLEYASEKGHALVNRRLYVPREWCEDQERRKECGIPEDVRFRTKGDLSYELIAFARQVGLTYTWITGDEEMGDAVPLHKRLEAIGEQYVFELSSNTRVWASLPQGSNHGSGGLKSRLREIRAGRPRSLEVRELARELPANAWREYVIRAGSKGPIVVKAALLRVHFGPRKERGRGPRWLLITQTVGQKEEFKYFKSNAPEDVDLREMLPAAYSRWSIEQCHGQGKNETGLGDYETRSWRGWHHHTALSMLAHHFLVLERIRLGGKIPGDDSRGVPAALHRHDPRGLNWLVQVQERVAVPTGT